MTVDSTGIDCSYFNLYRAYWENSRLYAWKIIGFVFITRELKVIHAGSYLFARAALRTTAIHGPSGSVLLSLVLIDAREIHLRTSSFSQSGVDAILHEVSAPRDFRPVFKQCQVISKLPSKLEFYSHPPLEFCSKARRCISFEHPRAFFRYNNDANEFRWSVFRASCVEHREVGGKIWFRNDGEVSFKKR